MTARIGFLYGYRSEQGALRPYVMHRALPMTTVLRDFGTELFMYSPAQVDAATGLVDGHLIENGRMIARRLPVPAVNGDWYLGEHDAHPGAMRRRAFAQWCRERDHELYADPRFSRLLKDKLKTYRLLGDLGLPQPYTEPWQQSASQLEHFLDRGRSVFLKPVRGNRGNGIAVLRAANDGYTLTRHEFGKRSTETPATLDEANEAINALATDRPYLVQHGLDAPPCAGAAFVFRVITVNDGDRWHEMRKVVVATDGGDVANTSQGGRNHTVEGFLSHHFGTAECATIVRDLREVSSRVTRMLESRHRNRIIELAFDLVLDADLKLSIVELNTKPGMMKPGLPENGFPDIFDLSAEEEAVYGRLVVPHATHLAKFLQRRLERRAERAAQDRATRGSCDTARREAA